jgi:signal transduction histidine kinase
MPASSARLSFSSQLAVFWALVAVMCALLCALVLFMARENAGRRIDAARERSVAGCQAVASRYDLSIDNNRDADPHTDLMHAILDVVLAQMSGVEGGFWRNAGTARGVFDAYAFPTYEGSGIKRDVPDAETPLILRTLRAAAAKQTTSTDVVSGQQDAVIVAACPVPHRPALLAWTLTRSQPSLGASGRSLLAALAVLLAGIVGIAIALGVRLRRWRAQLASVERSVAQHASAQPDGTALIAEPIGKTGEPELDRIVEAFNTHAARTAALRSQTADLNARLAQAERFSALGRLAAQIAHEIRNPIGAMRLKAENALAGDENRKQRALATILEQIHRVEEQLSGLLALTQPVRVDARPVAVRAWLDERVALHREAAANADVALTIMEGTAATPALAFFDPAQLSRALDNLVLNALRHTPQGGSVTVHASQVGDTLRVDVADDGPGVPQAERERIFEPFVTGHAAGSGLGLAVVREIAAAHGGRAFYEARQTGACFVIEIPWRTS